jgi:hypothetical protein
MESKAGADSRERRLTPKGPAIAFIFASVDYPERDFINHRLHALSMRRYRFQILSCVHSILVDNVAVTFRHFSLARWMMVRDSWLGTTANLGSIGALYNLTMDPYEKYDMVFNGAAPSRVLTSSPGRYTGEDNGWALSLIYPAIIDFDKSIIKYPNITRYVGGASTDLVPDLQHPDNPVPLLKDQIDRLHIGGNGG